MKEKTREKWKNILYNVRKNFNYDGLSTQVPVSVEEGLKHPSAIRCDELISILKSRLTDYIGVLSKAKLAELGQALSIALGIDSQAFNF